MYELKIFDKDNEQRHTITNYEVFNALYNADANIAKGEWYLYKGAYGYGEYICSLEDAMNDKDMIIVDGKKLFSVLRSNKEYFYHVNLHKCNSDLQIGLFDSTYYFIRSENSVFLKKLKLLFRETSLIKLDRGTIHMGDKGTNH